MKRCPVCSIANPDSSLRCDCGFDFQSGMAEVARSRYRARHVGELAVGGTMLASALGGLAVGLAAGTGTVLLCIGLLGAGIGAVYRGVAGLSRSRRAARLHEGKIATARLLR